MAQAIGNFFGDSSPRKTCIAEAAMVLVNDKQLNEFSAQFSYSSKGFVIWERVLNKLDRIVSRVNDEDQYDSEELLHLIREWVVRCVEDEGGMAEFISNINRVAPVVRSVGARYTAIRSQGLENSDAAMTLMLTYALAGFPDLTLTREQEEGLITAVVLLRSSGDLDFMPLFVDRNLSIDYWLTRKVLATPTDTDGNIAAFHARIARAKFISEKMGWSLDDQLMEWDFMCDYPDDLIDRLMEVKNESSPYNAWDDLRRYSLIEAAHNSSDQVSELIYFMKPYTEQYRVSYLFGVIRPTLRSHKFLPPMEDYSKAPERLRDQCVALLRVNLAISDSVGKTHTGRYLSDETLIRDQRLIDAIMNHPEDAEGLATIIEERKTDNFDIISGIYRSPIGDGDL